MQEYNDMLFDSAKIIHTMLKTKHKGMTMEEAKIAIASANTLAQTIKTAIQAEVIQFRLDNTKGNIAQVIHSINNEN